MPDWEEGSVGLVADLVADALYDFAADECAEYGFVTLKYFPAFESGIFFRLKSAFTISRALFSMSSPSSLQILSSAICSLSLC